MSGDTTDLQRVQRDRARRLIASIKYLNTLNDHVAAAKERIETFFRMPSLVGAGAETWRHVKNRQGLLAEFNFYRSTLRQLTTAAGAAEMKRLRAHFKHHKLVTTQNRLVAAAKARQAKSRKKRAKR